MSEILINTVISIILSFAIGIFLIWKGQQTVNHLKKLPKKRRLKLYCAVYLRALHSFPHRYFFTLFYGLFMSIFILGVSFLICAVFIFYVKQHSSEHPTLIQNAKALFSIDSPWVPMCAIIYYIAAFWYFNSKVKIDMMVPYVYRDLQRLRECVEKCATVEQFLSYTYAESQVKNIKELRSLFNQAKTIISKEFKLVDEFIETIADE